MATFTHYYIHIVAEQTDNDPKLGVVELSLPTNSQTERPTITYDLGTAVENYREAYEYYLRNRDNNQHHLLYSSSFDQYNDYDCPGSEQLADLIEHHQDTVSN